MEIAPTHNHGFPIREYEWVVAATVHFNFERLFGVKNSLQRRAMDLGDAPHRVRVLHIVLIFNVASLGHQLSHDFTHYVLTRVDSDQLYSLVESSGVSLEGYETKSANSLYTFNDHNGFLHSARSYPAYELRAINQ
ncbi:hypothetical protein FGO68_gene11632 [Halteria grandinella]|uniref:Uncharacterized protein n=1 Tax=Halteria grandinella TaxID=5974 RepID=A0A8J8SYB4_HALGN|nr:hypothetical protein FGO68_gene11632 [Halteria grandinella]